MKKRILSIITALALTLALFPAAAVPAGAASSGRTVQVSDSSSFNNAIKNLQDGDTIQLTASFTVTTPTSSNDSLFLGKKVTIDGKGNWLSLRYAGVLLGADVTFKNVSLGLASNVRPAIMANGHTLTLEDVKRDPINRNINLFCGGQTGRTQGDLAAQHQGNHGQIILKGNTYLGPTGRIFAGSISTDGKENVFAKPATVTIDPSVKGDSIGELYACGALETYTSENDWFDYQNEIDPPFASPGNFKVSGNVTFNLYQGKVGKVSGDTGVGGNLAQVNYKGSTYLNDNLVLSSIGGLTVESGNLAPTAGKLVQNNADTANRTSEIVSDSGGSCFGSTNAPLAVAVNATLGLQKLDNTVTVGSFTGGGSLVLGQSQKLVVGGTVSGTTTVGIGGIFNGHSQAIPAENFTYIDAASSQVDSFTLAAPAGKPDIKLARSENGAWTAKADENVVIVNDFKLASAVVESSSGEDADLPSLPFENVMSNQLNSPFSDIFEANGLSILVDGNETTPIDDGWDSNNKVYSGSNLWLSVTDNGHGTGEVLQVSGENYVQPPAGTYVISVTVPAENSGTGQPITRTATLTVKAAGGGPTAIPEPTANTGLVYNGKAQIGVPVGGAYVLESGVASAIDAGDYTAKVKPAADLTWENGLSNSVDIGWSIAQADNLELPAGLNAAAPSAYGKSDGKITGTTANMQYAKSADFSDATNCTANETTGLQAGDYYVRIKESANYKAGSAVMVTVPQGPITVTSIAISSSSHKTSYKVGEPLDVTGLTLTVTMSDNSQYLVPVAAGMVSNFDSSTAAQSQTLTITYGGKTVTYNIKIEVDTNPVTSIAITSTNHKTQYTVGDPLDVTGLELTVTRQTGAPEKIAVLANMVTGFNSGKPVNSQTLTVTYCGKTTTYTVSIAEGAATDPAVVTGVALNKSSMTLTVGSSERLTATVSPSTAANRKVTWASENTAVATVDAGGNVTALSAGTAVITVTTENGGKTASCTVTVGSKEEGGSAGEGDGSMEITRNPDGSTTITITDKTTGTVTETTKNTDGSTTVVETKQDGTVTTTGTTQDGIQFETVSKPGANTSARVTLPDSVREATVTLPGKVTAGTVAVDAKTGEIVRLSAPNEAGIVIKLDASAELILEDRSKTFADTDGHWAKNAIDFTTAHALFNGTSDTTFTPDKSMTRGMVAVVLHNFEGNPDFTVQNSFSDVASGTWYTDAINWITDKGIAQGYGNGSFGTNNHVTREQLVTFLYRYANTMGYSTEGSADLSAFSDGASVSGYAAEAMRWAIGNGLVKGTDKGTLAPGSGATRAQVASILNRFVLNLMK